MSAGGSTKVIIISLCANFGIALSKLAGSFYTGSATLMAEAVHSFSDCGNQVLLLYGQHVSKKPFDARYPLGRSKEMFFWSFVVALLLFSMGGLFSIYEGIHKLQHPEAMHAPFVGIAILVVAIVLEGYSFWACYKEVRAQNTHGSLWRWIKRTNSTDLLVIFLEDFAALGGLFLALAALLVAWLGDMPHWDGIGSLMIGVLLIGVAVLLAREVKPLLIGEAPSEDYETSARAVIAEIAPGMKLLRLIAVQQGIGAVMLAYKIHPGDARDVMETITLVNRIEAELRRRHPDIQWQFAELDTHD